MRGDGDAVGVRKFGQQRLGQFDLRDQVGLILVRVADPSRSSEVANGIDKLFQNSLAETRSESEKAFNLSFISMASAIITAIQIVSGMILVILGLILGNTLAMSTRERTTEYATMRAIGFQPAQIVMLVIGEGLVVELVADAVEGGRRHGGDEGGKVGVVFGDGS